MDTHSTSSSTMEGPSTAGKTASTTVAAEVGKNTFGEGSTEELGYCSSCYRRIGPQRSLPSSYSWFLEASLWLEIWLAFLERLQKLENSLSQLQWEQVKSFVVLSLAKYLKSSGRAGLVHLGAGHNLVVKCQICLCGHLETWPAVFKCFSYACFTVIYHPPGVLIRVCYE